MLIEISYHKIDKTDAIDEHVHESVNHALHRFDQRLTRVEVHVGDHNADKAGPNDKRCLMEARPKGLGPIAVEHEGDDLYAVIKEAAKKLHRALERKLERHDEHR
jgi:ribosomal subunit interface protein